MMTIALSVAAGFAAAAVLHRALSASKSAKASSVRRAIFGSGGPGEEDK